MKQFFDVFGDVNFGVEAKHKTVHRIKTSGKQVSSQPKQLTPEKLKIAKIAFDAFQRFGIIRPSKSPYSSTLHMVPKKKIGDWRPCVDYRSLNHITVRDSCPLLRLSMIELNGRKNVFSKLDLVKAYHQIPIHSDDTEKKTAVTTPFRLLEFIRMPEEYRKIVSTLYS